MPDCSDAQVSRYKTKNSPRCNDGEGCSPCWTKYHLSCTLQDIFPDIIYDYQSGANSADEIIESLREEGVVLSLVEVT